MVRKERKVREPGTRAANGESSIYLGGDGKWHGRVTVGTKDDGSPDRRHVERATENEVIRRVNEIERERDAGTISKAGRVPTVAEWLSEWVEEISKPTVRYKSYRAYESAVRVHLIPGLGKHRINKIQPEHFERLYAKMIAAGAKPGTAHQVHRTARTAFGEALRRGRISRNPVALAKAPRLDEDEIEPFETEEIRRLITTALKRRNGVRYVIALALGTRQAETTGLRWNRYDPSTRTVRIVRQIQRHTWKHGCSDPHVCGERLHKRRPCPESCTRHTRSCPAPCLPSCTSHARSCPQRHGGGMVEVDVKSRAGRRGIVLPDQLAELLEEHRVVQETERVRAGTEWQDGGWMFAQENGKPIDPTMDRNEWRRLLTDAGVRTARLHDARHTAATVLLLLGVSQRVAMEVMGWSHGAMAKRYQHVTDALRQDVAVRLDGFLRAGTETGNETEAGQEPDDE
ncbi:integrase (recombinase) [Pseudonocardia sp. Ae406_Ps2]|uniref:tyrosine-type recombinase/integrase n=1 Tax=unclassified Pseudonocardia TaxID=2619320 RepID=UPI00094AB464|nr:MULTISPECIES: site-specific integrase [unclassified Pseudonocardia]OLL98055.1 integrase (recombinase) [Pseudonocardia sp. Ae331_Ps2]OLM04236.1 integrase (recombinase) [Pseudonocardia sp. Ae406_Ps2]OLM10937.1 integrase (recombinase) [Pseudonocardia sp. Ae505_Ps2]OLM25787.1 integrase (recombinase) [Pseudonocardia sp. Ae706_Ps2]